MQIVLQYKDPQPSSYITAISVHVHTMVAD